MDIWIDPATVFDWIGLISAAIIVVMIIVLEGARIGRWLPSRSRFKRRLRDRSDGDWEGSGL